MKSARIERTLENCRRENTRLAARLADAETTLREIAEHRDGMVSACTESCALTLTEVARAYFDRAGDRA